MKRTQNNRVEINSKNEFPTVSYERFIQVVATITKTATTGNVSASVHVIHVICSINASNPVLHVGRVVGAPLHGRLRHSREQEVKGAI